MIYSCKNCKDRSIGCHSHCERYAKEKIMHDEQRARAKADDEARMYMLGSMVRSMRGRGEVRKRVKFK